MAKAALKPAEGVFKRVGQTFDLFFHHLKELFLYPLVVIAIMLGSSYFFNIYALNHLNLVEALEAGDYSILLLDLPILGWLGFPLLLILKIFLGIIFAWMVLSTVSAFCKGKNVSFIEVLTSSFKNIWRYIKIAFSQAVYVLLWPAVLAILAVLVLFALINMFFGGEPSILKTALNFSLFFLGALCIFSVWIFAVIRGIRVLLAFSVAVDDAKKGGRDSVQTSIKLVKGRWWRTLGNLLLFGILTLLIMFALGGKFLPQEGAIGWQFEGEIPFSYEVMLFLDEDQFAQLQEIPGVIEEVKESLNPWDVTALLALAVGILVSTLVLSLQNIFWYLLYKRYQQETK